MCMCVKSHLTSGVSVRHENTVTYVHSKVMALFAYLQYGILYHTAILQRYSAQLSTAELSKKANSRLT